MAFTGSKVWLCFFAMSPNSWCGHSARCEGVISAPSFHSLSSTPVPAGRERWVEEASLSWLNGFLKKRSVLQSAGHSGSSPNKLLACYKAWHDHSVTTPTSIEHHCIHQPTSFKFSSSQRLSQHAQRDMWISLAAPHPQMNMVQAIKKHRSSWLCAHGMESEPG